MHLFIYLFYLFISSSSSVLKSEKKVCKKRNERFWIWNGENLENESFWIRRFWLEDFQNKSVLPNVAVVICMFFYVYDLTVCLSTGWVTLVLNQWLTCIKNTSVSVKHIGALTTGTKEAIVYSQKRSAHHLRRKKTTNISIILLLIRATLLHCNRKQTCFGAWKMKDKLHWITSRYLALNERYDWPQRGGA